MGLLILYISIAIVFSFICSIAEAVLLSVTPSYIALLEENGRKSGRLLRDLKKDIHRPLSAILTLNTVAHTLGAAGAGAQATVLFGDAVLGIASALLTLLILVFSEIIPKTLGAAHWRQLAPATARGLKILVWSLYPFVVMSEALTRMLSSEKTTSGLSRLELAALADIGEREGILDSGESVIIRNLMRFQDTRVKDIMTPRSVLFSLPDDVSVSYYFHSHADRRFSRIPVYNRETKAITGFVLRADLLLAQARGNDENSLQRYARKIQTMPVSVSIAHVFNELLRVKTQIIMLVNEYGDYAGLVTMEDVLETLIGLEIIDESDLSADMQKEARKLWRQRIRQMGIELEDS